MELQWAVKRFDQLTTRELYAIYKAREAVFVVEQDCPYEEVDAHDLDSLHLFAEDQMHNVVAYSRIFLEKEQVSFGRVLVNRKNRGQGLGRILVSRVLESINEHYPNRPVEIEAQEYVQSFYTSFGFRPLSKVFLLDNIPHLKMRLDHA
ncbi:MAG: GNAT family N-acetyltransferase [Sporolactobacillus sp.]